MIQGLLPAPALADGMLVLEPEPRHPDRFDLHAEASQDALIEHSGGVERLLLRVAAEVPSGRSALWLVPLPAPPERVVLDVVGDMPRLGGEEVGKKARMAVEDAVVRLRDLQFHLALHGMLKWMSIFFAGMSLGDLSADEDGARAGSPSQDVRVHARLEKRGVVSELVTARSPQGLSGYLKSKGLSSGAGALPVLAGYIGREYSFVVSWIAASAGQAGVKDLALSASFPSERPYYPMALTSAYGERVIPATVRVKGHVSLRTPESLRPFLSTEYFAGDADPYTRVRIEAPSRLFTEDLWFDPGAPLKIRYFMALIGHPRLLLALLAVLASLLAGLLAGLPVFRERRGLRGLGWLAGLGLANCLSSAGLWLVLLSVRTRPESEGSGWWRGRLDGRKLVYAPLFAVLYLAALHICEGVLAPLP